MNPDEILGVPANASEEDIRTAYLDRVKEFPPDRAPEDFERIRDAYNILRDPRKRAEAMLFGNSSVGPLVTLLEGYKPRRIFAGPQPWREVLKAK
jgi:DnaJ-class molecular chaperone